jgi:hypothetical protein
MDSGHIIYGTVLYIRVFCVCGFCFLREITFLQEPSLATCFSTKRRGGNKTKRKHHKSIRAAEYFLNKKDLSSFRMEREANGLACNRLGRGGGLGGCNSSNCYGRLRGRDGSSRAGWNGGRISVFVCVWILFLAWDHFSPGIIPGHLFLN